MAKKKQEVEQAVEVVNTDLIITPESIKQAMTIYHPIEAELIEITENYKALTVKDTKDVAGMAAVTAAYKHTREIRLKIEKIRKAINEAPLTLQRTNNSVAERLTSIAKPCEDQLKSEIDTIEKQLENEKRQEEQRRNKMLQDAGYQMAGQFWICGPYQIAWTQIMEMSEEAIEQAVKNAQAFKEEEAKRLEEKRIAEEKAELARKAEEDRLAKEKAELEAEREKLRQEQEEFRKWKEQAAAAATAATPPAPEPEPTHAVTVHQEQAPQKVVEPVVVPAASAATPEPAPTAPEQPITEIPFAGTKVTPEFALGFNTCRGLIVKDFENTELKLTRQGWVDRFKGMEAPQDNFSAMYREMRAFQKAFLAGKNQSDLESAKKIQANLDLMFGIV